MYYAQHLTTRIKEVSESSSELLLETMRKLVIGVGVAWFIVWMFAGMSEISLQYGAYFAVMVLVGLLSAVTLVWMPYRPLASICLWLVGQSLLVTMAAIFFPGSVFIYFYLPLPIMATILLRWYAGAGMEIVLVGELYWLSRLHLVQFQSPENLGMILVSTLLAILGWASFDSFLHVTLWASFYAQQAKKALEEARQRQSDLFDTQEDLLTVNQELARLSERLKALQQIADEARQAKGEFVANVSHELRAPLNMIIGYTELITRSVQSYGKRLPAPLLADIATIQRNAQHLSRLVDDVLDLSQIEAGRMALSREKSSFGKIVETAMEVVHPLYASKGLYLTAEVPPDLPPVFCDQTRIRQIIINLLSNAGRFTEQGGVRISVEPGGAGLVCHVADTGPGIAKEQQAQLFEPFQQVDASIRREHGGSGLGLSISRRFVEMHDGKIWLESEPGKGTTISFTLPIHTPVDGEPRPTSSVYRWVNEFTVHDRRNRPLKASLPALVPRYILVETGGALKRFFGRYMEDISVESFTDVDKAIQELDHAPAQALIVNTPDVVDPLAYRALSERLSALPYETPVITCWLPGKDDFAHTLGVVDYIFKPVDMENLLASIHKMGEQVHSILVVDDEEDALQLMMRILLAAPEKYRVWRAASGEVALQMMRTRRPDLVLLDMVLPEKDGLQVLAEKRSDEAIRDIPVMIVTSMDPYKESITADTLLLKRKNGLSARELVEFFSQVGQVLTPHVQQPGSAPGAAPLD
jgi:signal transduction histidine kinase/CheY-like chemotaxis protein